MLANKVRIASWANRAFAQNWRTERIVRPVGTFVIAFGTMVLLRCEIHGYSFPQSVGAAAVPTKIQKPANAMYLLRAGILILLQRVQNLTLRSFHFVASAPP